MGKYVREPINGITHLIGAILSVAGLLALVIKTSIKDYIEVNSAIALALDGIGYGFDELNFLTAKSSSKNFLKKAASPRLKSVPWRTLPVRQARKRSI